MGFFSSIGDVFSGAADFVGDAAQDVGEFVAPALPAIGTVAGTALGGPAGGAIGGSAGEAASTALTGGNSSEIGQSALSGGIQGGIGGTVGGLLGGGSGASSLVSPGLGGAGSSTAFLDDVALNSGTGGGLGNILGGGLPQIPNSIGGAFNSAANVFTNNTGQLGLGNLATSGLGGVLQTQQLGEIADAQRAANRQAQNTVSPFVNAGTTAQNRLGELLGLSGQDNDEVLEALRSSPGFQFRLEQGQEALDRTLASRGNLFSGRALEESQRLGQGLADQTFTDFTNTLQRQAAQGLNAAQGQAVLQGITGDIRANRLGAQGDVLNRTLADILAPRI